LTNVAPSDHLSACEDYYGLIAHPFSLTPDLRFVYPSRSHSHAFAEVTDALKRREGLIVVTGEIGTGKTVLCRTLLETFEARTFLSVILDPRLGVDDLIRQVLTDFGLIARDDAGTRPRDVDRHQLVSTLQRFLSTLIPVSAHAVIMIDEAQHLDPTVLEEIRLLSNFETNEAKLLQIVLVGQPDLDDVLRRPDMRQISQRIARRVTLHPLSPDEVQDYIERRLVVASGAGTQASGERPAAQFTPDAVQAVAGISAGIPRVINTVCNQALEIGFEQQTPAIDRAVVLAAARRLKLPAPMPFRLPGGAHLRAAAAVILASGALGGWWWSRSVSGSAAPAALVTPLAARTTTPTAAASDGTQRTPLPPPVPAPAPAPARPVAPVTPGKPSGGTSGAYEITVAAFRTAQRAEEVADAIAQRGLPVSTRSDPTGAWHRIVVGPLNSVDEAESVQRALARQGFSGTKISPSPR
jgi:general secretion pathway protein A